MPFSGIAIYKNRRSAAAVNRLLDTHVLTLFHTASALSAPSLRLPLKGNAIKVKEIVSYVTSCFPLRGAPPMGSQERSAA